MASLTTALVLVNQPSEFGSRLLHRNFTQLNLLIELVLFHVKEILSSLLHILLPNFLSKFALFPWLGFFNHLFLSQWNIFPKLNFFLRFGALAPGKRFFLNFSRLWSDLPQILVTLSRIFESG